MKFDRPSVNIDEAMIDVSYYPCFSLHDSQEYHTEITAYLWSGFLGEWDSTKETFHAWELVSPYVWKNRPDIYQPPAKCIGITKTPASVQILGSQTLYQFPQVCRLLQQAPPQQLQMVPLLPLSS